MAEAVGCEGLARRRHHEVEVVDRHRIDDRPQFGVDRDAQRRARLLLSNVDEPVVNVLTAHAGHIADSLPGIEQQSERQARLRADRVLVLEARNIRFAPSLPSLFAQPGALDANSRVIGSDSYLNGISEHLRLERKNSRRAGRLAFGVNAGSAHAVLL